jgi:hypothetical protein
MTKDKYNRTPRQIKRLYGNVKEIFGTNLPSTSAIQEYKNKWTKEARESELILQSTTENNTQKIGKWLRKQGVTRLNYHINVIYHTVVIRDPKVFILAKLKFSG